VYHAEITAIMDACARLNSGAPSGGESRTAVTLELVPRETGSSDPAPERTRMLKGCEIYVNAAPCPMCMSAIYWARLDRVYFGAGLEDTRAIGFDDVFQYEDFTRPWDRRRIEVVAGFERELCLTAFRVWENKRDRRPY
jgi:tRNA(Arg) A34 adenosine deaminase TadA